MVDDEETRIAQLEAEIESLKRGTELHSTPGEDFSVAHEDHLHQTPSPKQPSNQKKLEALRNIPLVQILDRKNRNGRDDSDAPNNARPHSPKAGKFAFARGRQTKQELELLHALETLETDKTLCEEEMRQKIQQSEMAIETLEKALIDADLTARNLQKEIEVARAAGLSSSASASESLSLSRGKPRKVPSAKKKDRTRSPTRKEGGQRNKSPSRSPTSNRRSNRSSSPGNI